MLSAPNGAIRRTASGYALHPYSKPYGPQRTPSYEKDSAHTSAPPWRFRMTRRFTRSLKRYTVWMLLFVILVVLWRELGLSVRGSEQSSATSRFSRIRGKGAKKRDLRHRSWPGWDGIRKIYAFGDSHADWGFDPKAEQPNTANPIGNPDFPGMTSCYGPNFLSHLTTTYNQSEIKTYNLARTGSTVRNSRHIKDLDPFGTGMGLEDQIDKLFLGNYDTSAAPGSSDGWTQEETLFVFYAGVDESMFEFIERGNDTSRNVTDVDLNMQVYLDDLEKIYDYGARNFLVIGIPGLEESPLMRNCEINKALGRFGAELLDLNGRLAFMTQLFAHRHTDDATVFFYNNHKTSILTRNDPKTFDETKGIQRLEGYCYFYEDKKEIIEFDPACKNPLDEFYWRDTRHHTEPFHRLMARMIFEQLSDVRNALPYEFY